MAHSVQKKIKFSKGQISPYLIERTDMDLYDSSAQEITNMVSTIYGGVRSRNGSKFIDYISKIDEITPISITSNVFESTEHFTDLENKSVERIGNNKTIGVFDYGENAEGTSVLEIKNIALLPYKKVITSGNTTATLLPGKYQITAIGGGGGGSAQGDQGKYSWKSSAAGGGSGGMAQAILIIDPTYQYESSAGQKDSYVELKIQAQNITCTMNTGIGGNGVGGNGDWGLQAGNGNTSTITLSTSTSIFTLQANGGTGGYTKFTDGDPARSAGIGGNSYYKHDTIEWLLSTGNNGLTATGYSYAKGGDSLYNEYGKGGDAQATGYNSGWGNNGNNGVCEIIQREGNFKIKISTSRDGEFYEELYTQDISETASDISVNMDYRYRFIKVEVENSNELANGMSFDYIRNAKSVTDIDKVRLESFIFNNEQKYLLVLYNENVQIFQNDRLIQVLSAPGLSGNYIKSMKITSKDDTIIITHPDMYPKKIIRKSTGFEWSDFELKNIPYFAFNGETTTAKTTGITPSETDGAVKITADSSIFDSSWVGQYIDGNGGRVKITSYTSTTVVNGYTVIPFYTKDKITSWDYISGYEPVWSATRGYPNTCLFAQQRLWFGGSRELPAHIWASRLADYNNFKNSGNYDNDSIDVTMLTNNKIVNMVDCRGLHIFTTGEEWTASESTYTPDKFSITINTTNGSYPNITPVVLNGVICYIEKNGKSLLSYVYDFNQSSYTSDNLSILCNLINKPIKLESQINSNVDRGDFLYMVKEDGTMAVSCVSLNQNIVSISQYETKGQIFDVCSVVDDVYIAVIRNGSMCIEKIEYESQTDCYKPIYIGSTEIKGLTQYNNNVVWVYSDKKNYGRYEVRGGTITLNEIPYENCKIGLAYNYKLVSNPIAINGHTDSVKKRIAKATLVCSDTKNLEFNNQKKSSTRDVYEFYACTNYSDDVRFQITGEFYKVNILSVTLNLNFEG